MKHKEEPQHWFAQPEIYLKRIGFTKDPTYGIYLKDPSCYADLRLMVIAKSYGHKN